MLRFLLSRIGLIVPTFIGVTFLSFMLIRLVPGDPIEVRAGEHGIPPERLARSILRACECRQAELVMPGKARLLFALSQLWPQWGDWIVRRMT